MGCYTFRDDSAIWRPALNHFGLILAFQTKDLLAPVQVVKAGYGILEPIIQIMIHIYQYCKLRKNYYYENETQMRFKTFEIIGSLLLIILSLVCLVIDH